MRAASFDLCKVTREVRYLINEFGLEMLKFGVHRGWRCGVP